MKKKICVTIPSMHGAGCERMLSEVLPFYAAEFEVDLVLLEHRMSYPIPEGVTIISLDRSLSKGGILRKVYTTFSVILRFRKLMQKTNYSAIVSYLDNYNVMVYLANAFRRRKPVHIACEHTLDREFFRNSSMARWKQKVTKFVIKKAYNRVDGLIAVSQNVKNFLSDDLEIKTPITVIHNGINTGKFNLTPPDDEAVIAPEFINAPTKLLCISRLDHQKNIPFLIDCFKAASNAIIDTNLFILGLGPLRQTIEEKIDLLNLNSRVFLLGFRDNPEDYLKLCDAFLLSSRYESFGNVLVEALACGIPVVTTNYGAVIDEIITSTEFGTVIEQGDVRGFADAIADVVTNSGQYDRVALNNYACSNFDVSKKANDYIETVQQLIAVSRFDPASRKSNS